MPPKTMKQRIRREFQKEKMEAIDWLLYDSFFNLTPAVVNRLEFFQQTTGQTAGGRERTNMKNGGMMPFPESFLVTEMWCEFRNNDNLAFEYNQVSASFALNAIIARSWFNFRREPSTLYEGHLSEMFGQMYSRNLVTTAGTSKQGSSYYVGKLKLRNPIVLRSNSFFVLELNIDAPAFADNFSAATKVYWYLKGIKRRNK